MDWIAVATFALASVTILLAVVTVFQKELRGLVYRPRLERPIAEMTPKFVVRTTPEWLARREEAPAPTPTPFNVPAGGPAPWYWVRMAIRNGTRCSDAAQDLEIFLDEIQQKSGVEGFKSLPNVGVNLCWSWDESTIYADILPGATKYFNIGHLSHPDERRNLRDYYSPQNAHNHAFLSLASFPRNPGYEAYFEPGTYRMRLLIGGKNVKTMAYWVLFEFREHWDPNPEQMLKGLSLRVES